MKILCWKNQDIKPPVFCGLFSSQDDQISQEKTLYQILLKKLLNKILNNVEIFWYIVFSITTTQNDNA